MEVVETPLAPEEERAAPSEEIPVEAPVEATVEAEAPVEAPQPKARAKRAPRPKAKAKVVFAPEPEVMEAPVTEAPEPPEPPKLKRQPSRAKPQPQQPAPVVVPRQPTLDEVMEMFRRSESERRAMKRNIYRSLVRL